MTSRSDTPSSPGEPSRQRSMGSGEDALQESLAELNRRLHELTEDIAARGSHAGRGSGAPERPDPASEPALGSEGPEDRAREIMETAQRSADEIMRNARREVERTRREPAAPMSEVASAREQTTNALLQTQHLLVLGEELLGATRSVLDVFERGLLHVGTEAAALREGGGSRPLSYAEPPRPTSAPLAASAAEEEWAAPVGAPSADAEQAGAVAPARFPRGGVSAAVTPPQAALDVSPAERSSPALPTFQVGQVTLTAGPLDDVAAAAVLERAVERIRAIDRARVKRFVDSRAVIELDTHEAVMLAEELRRVLPYPFEAQVVGPSELDIVILPASPHGGSGVREGDGEWMAE